MGVERLTERYKDRIAGTLSRYDRITIQGTVPLLRSSERLAGVFVFWDDALDNSASVQRALTGISSARRTARIPRISVSPAVADGRWALRVVRALGRGMGISPDQDWHPGFFGGRLRNHGGRPGARRSKAAEFCGAHSRRRCQRTDHSGRRASAFHPGCPSGCQ